MALSLGSDEKIIYTAKKHWFSLFWPFVLTAATGFALIPWAIYALLRYLGDEILVTNKKVHIKTGVISKNVVATPVAKINNININKGILGRMLNYGTIIIQSGATFGASGYSYIAAPEELQQIIESASEGNI